MPVLYQAFHEITNFIRNNGDDWDEFCTKTAHTTRNAKKASDPSKNHRSSRLLKTKDSLPNRYSMKMKHCFVLFPIHHNDIWQMYKKAEASF